MQKGIILPTSRAIRQKISNLKEANQFLDKYLTIGEFEAKAIYVENKIFVDKYKRVLYLKEAVERVDIDYLSSKEIISFFKNSKDLFDFFEELFFEEVELSDISYKDSYGFFLDELAILEEILKNYKAILDSKGLTDRMFIPKEFKLNSSYLKNFSKIEFYLEGYLSRFEFRLFDEISKIVPFKIFFRSTPFNKKMQERFREYGVDIKNNKEVVIDFSNKRVLKEESKEIDLSKKVELYGVSNRLYQIDLAFLEIEKMVKDGANPSNIALIIPDEGFIYAIKLFDRFRNINFAMGFSFENRKLYKILDALFNYLGKRDEESKEFLELNSISKEDLEKFNTKELLDLNGFFEQLKRVNIAPFDGDYEDYFSEFGNEFDHFKRVFLKRKFILKEWLFLFLEFLKEIREDDINGGKITAMGLLESRGVEFDGIVILDFNNKFVPSFVRKDRFLNSWIRKRANLPTKEDREDLQKQHYLRALERSKRGVIIYTQDQESLPSYFLKELNLEKKDFYEEVEAGFISGANIIRDDEIEVRFDPLKFEWSPFSLKLFLECKRAFFYRYILEISESNQDIFYDGRILHKVLKDIFNKRDFFDNEKEFLENFKVLLAKELNSKRVLDRYKKRVFEYMIKDFIKTQIKHFLDGYRVYKKEIEVSGVINNLKFRGRVDRLDIKEDEALVIDYKLNGVDIKTPQNTTDFQLFIYIYLLQKNFKEIKGAYIDILKRGEIKYLSRYDEYIGELLEKTKEIANLDSFVAKECDNLYLCRNCPYNILCQRGDFK